MADRVCGREADERRRREHRGAAVSGVGRGRGGRQLYGRGGVYVVVLEWTTSALATLSAEYMLTLCEPSAGRVKVMVVAEWL